MAGWIGEVSRWPDYANLQMSGRRQETLANSRIEDRCFPARVGTDQQNSVGDVDAYDAAVKQVEVSPTCIELRTVLATIEVARPQRRHQVLKRRHALGIAQITGDSTDAVARHSFQLRRYD